jgi:hypothetical protein
VCVIFAQPESCHGLPLVAGSAVLVERVFSGDRDTVALRRTSLSAETIRELMLVKHHLRRKQEHRFMSADV